MSEQSSCGRCGEHNRSDAAYCATCGAPLSAGHGLGAVPEGAATSEQVDAPRFGETGPAVAPMGAPMPAEPPPMEPHAPPVSHTPTQVFAVTAATPPKAGVEAPVVASSRSTSVMIAVLAVAIVAILGGVFFLVASGPDDAVPPVADSSTSTTAVLTPDTAPGSTPDSTVADTLSPESTAAPVDPVVDPVDDAASTTVVASTVPDAGPTRALGDLGLDQPILDEVCDGRYVTFVGSAVGDLAYTDVVSTLLADYPGTNYIWTKACPSLRQEFSDGSDIYGVVFGPYPTLAEACAAAGFGPADAYVRRISTTDPPDHTVDC